MAIDISGMAEYQAVIHKINLWYGSDAQQIIDIVNQYELTPRQVADGYLTGSGFEPWYSTSGAVGGYMSRGTAPINPATAVQEAANSNVGETTQVILKTPVETTVNQSGNVQTSMGLTSVATGAKSALTFISKEVLPAVSAAGLGITLGKTISKAAYDAGFNWLSWAGVDMESLNPETWNSITADYPDGPLKKAFNTIFGLNPDTGETQMYLDQDAVTYLAQYMQEIGMFSGGEGSDTASIDDTTGLDAKTISQMPFACGLASGFTFNYSDAVLGGGSRDGSIPCISNINATDTVYVFGYAVGASSTASCQWYVVSKSAFSLLYTYHSASWDRNSTITGTRTSVNNRDIYISALANLNVSPYVTYSVQHLPYYSDGVIPNQIGYVITYGTISAPPSPIEGITTQDGATTPDFSGCTTPQDYLNALQTQYPDMFNGAVTQSVANPDGTTSTKTYLPIGTPSSGNTNQPVTTGENSGNQQSGQSANPNTVDLTGLQNLIDQLTKTISKTGTPTDITNPDPTGSGKTPPVVVPTGSASALWTVYNPTQAQLNSFGAWLWSSNFIDQVLKLFNNPMQSIIGVHKIFASPSISGASNITVGYLDSGVSANVVGAQYTTVNCGTVKVREQFGNVFDYNDTYVRLYLPFIGIVPLDVMDVMRGSVNVVYHVDVITGACLAEVKVTRDGGGGTLYQYAGDAAVRYPISSGSYMGVVSGVLGVVGGIASGIMSGGATLPMAAGAIASGMSQAKTQVQHSGSFAGNAGAMGGKKPYLIIERPQTAVADGYGAYQGTGANNIVNVSAMSGYFKMTDVHLDSIARATESELSEIENLLLSGVIT